MWSDEEWATLSKLIGLEDPSLADADARLERVEQVESAVSSWTRDKTATEVVEALQARGIEAVPVQDFGDVLSDPQLSFRRHFQTLTHPFMGEGPYERNGFRLSDAPAGYRRTSPTLGQDNRTVLGDLLGMEQAEIDSLQEQGALD